MEKGILAAGFDGEKRNKIMKMHFVYDFPVCFLPTISDVVKILAEENNFMIVIIFLHSESELHYIQIIRTLTSAPILVLKEKYVGAEKIAAIEVGADEYIQWPETIQELTASCDALLRRYTVLNMRQGKPGNMVLQGGILIYEDYRKIIICGRDMQFTSREFEVFSLLAACPGRVFTYGQMSEMFWDDGQLATENSLHSCVRRIRRKLETVPECPCSIENVRSVGYCFRHKKTEK